MAEPTPALVPAGANDNAAARKCRSAADALEKHIMAKHDSANRMLAQPPTRKRLQEADTHRKEAIRLQRIQLTLRRLAEMHEKGSIAPALGLTSRAALERALFSESQNSTLRALYDSTDCPETGATVALGGRAMRVAFFALWGRAPANAYRTPHVTASERAGIKPIYIGHRRVTANKANEAH